MSVEANRGESFTEAEYRGVKYAIRERDGYINLTQLFETRYRKVSVLMEIGRWKDAVQKCGQSHPEVAHVFYNLNADSFEGAIAGTYIHPDILPTIIYVIDYLSMCYAINLKNKMENLSLRQQEYECRVDRLQAFRKEESE
jgi:hypothetical protein